MGQAAHAGPTGAGDVWADPLTPMPAWSPTSLTADVVAVAAAEHAAYAALADGRVLRALGDGPWETVAEEVGVPLALLATPHALLLATVHGLRRLDGARVTPADGLPDDADVVALGHARDVAIAGIHGHGVFRSEDGGATWAEANGGLPFRGVGLAVSGFAATDKGLFVAHGLGVSRSRDAGRAWETAGAGLPLRIGRLAVAASGGRVFAEADGRLFQLHGDAWTEWGADAVGLLGADEQAVYGLGAAGLVWRSPDGGAWSAYGDGLPAVPRRLASGAAWRLAALVSGALWRRPALPPPRAAGVPRLDGVPPFLSGPAWVTVTLPAPTALVLALVDGDGAEVARLAEGFWEGGAHRLPVSVADAPSGLYRCRLTVGEHVVSYPLAVLAAAP